MRRTYLQECQSCEEPVIASAAKQPRGVRCPHLTQSWRYIVTILIALTLCASASFADTTWVAGTVSGVWSREGNPYLVTDTLTIPYDSTLNILPGVQIYFQNQQIRKTPINVLGQLRAVGAEGDSIYFYSPVAGFGGINNRLTRGTEIRLEYCVLDSISMNSSIESTRGRVIAKHSRIHSGAVSIGTFEEIDTVQYCRLFSGAGANLNNGGPSIFQYNQGGGLSAFYQQMEPVMGNHVTYIDFYTCAWTEVFDNEIEIGYLIYTNSFWHHNQITHDFYGDGSELFFEHNIVGSSSTMGLTMIRTYEVDGTIRENEIHGYVRLYESNFTIEKNLIVSLMTGLEIWDSPCLVDGNTFIFNLYAGIYGSSPTTQIVSNNIFVGNGVDTYGIRSLGSGTWDIRYNDFYYVIAPTYGCVLDTGNIFLDPRFLGGSPFDYHLQANSPCIDSGDPTTPSDPDCTRADMGFFYYDQRIDHPPAMTSPLVADVELGTTFRYEAHATDDYGPLRFGFWNLPGWLHPVHGNGTDWVGDSALVMGLVPQNQENFNFGVWVEDGLAQIDSQEVLVQVSSYTILNGEVTGFLSVANSPYLVVEDVIIPGGDSLRIEPGVEIRFQWEDFYYHRHCIIVRGQLIAMGTEEDTIRFISEYSDTSASGWRGIYFVGLPEDTSTISYVFGSSCRYGIIADSLSSVLVRHSEFKSEFTSIIVRNSSWAYIDSCNMQSDEYCTYLNVNGGHATILNCTFIHPPSPDFGGHIDFQYGSSGTVQNCSFTGGHSCSFDNSSIVNFIGNDVSQLYYGVTFGNGTSGIIANNRFSGSRGLNLYSADSTMVFNNTFYNLDGAVVIDQTTSEINEIFVKNNIFLDNTLAIRASYPSGPFENICYNDFYDNDTNFVNCLLDSTNIYLDPIIQDTINFRLLAGSPCIDAGDPDPFFNDVDSTRNDIGCWGGPWGQSYPYVPILSHLTKPLPTEFALLPPYPNPFNSVLVIPFAIPVQKEVIINIYNILGQKVQEFTFPPLSPGMHQVTWNSGACASGIYFVRMTVNGQECKRKVVLLK